VVRYLQDHGYPYAERRALHGTDDRGDIAGVPGVMFECKSVKSITLAEFANEVAVQTKNAGARVGVTVIKRRQRPVGDAYVVMSLAAFVDLIRDDEEETT
jgi:hypothetical protein